MEKLKGESLKKDEVLNLWAGLVPAEKIRPCSIPYKHEGTTIAEDGIRICGSKPFIFSVMSRLKDMLEQENGETRLGVAFSQIQDIKTGQLVDGAYRCSIQVHERGGQAQQMNAFIAAAKGRQEARAQLQGGL